MTSRPRTPNVRVAFLSSLFLILGQSLAPAMAAELAPPPPPDVDIAPPPPLPAITEPEPKRDVQVAQAAAPVVYQQPSGDPYGFTDWLNGVRAQYGLGAVGVDPNLSGWAAVNNGQQQAMGMGHHVMGPARRQNAGMGAMSTVCQMWMASPSHQAALLDPSITWIGIAGAGAYWTFNAY